MTAVCSVVVTRPGQGVPTCSRCPGPAGPPPPPRRPHPSPPTAAWDSSCINFPPRGKSSSCWSMAWWPTVASDFKFIRILHIWYILSSTVFPNRAYRSLAYYRVCHLIMMLRTVTELSAGWWGATWPGSSAECVSRVTASNHTPSCGSHSWSHTHFIMISKLRRQYNLVQFSPICGGWWVSQLTTQSDQAWPPPATATTHPPARPACAGGGGQSS